MKAGNLLLIPSVLQNSTHVERRCECVWTSESGSTKRETLWFRFPSGIPLPPAEDCDSYLLAKLLPAMRQKYDIHIEGAINRQLLRNMFEFQGAWIKWKPLLYSKVGITCRVRDDEIPVNQEAVLAFSGGVDANFSLARAMPSKLPESHNVTRCCFVHGFDIPLKEIQTFATVHRTLQTDLEGTGIPLIPVATNLRQTLNAPWEDVVGTALAAVLNQFKRLHGVAIVGSTEPYDKLIPWGSHPATDHLLAGLDFGIVHDGATHSRPEKLAYLFNRETAPRNLRVCWTNPSQPGNCGKCEKCLRTKAALYAFGLETHLAIDNKRFTWSISKLKRLSPLQKQEWQEVLKTARRRNASGSWLWAVRWLLLKTTCFDTLLPHGSLRRKLARRFSGQH